MTAIELVDLAIDLLATGAASGGTALYDACCRAQLNEPQRHPVKDEVLTLEGPIPCDMSIDDRIASLQRARAKLATEAA